MWYWGISPKPLNSIIIFPQWVRCSSQGQSRVFKERACAVLTWWLPLKPRGWNLICSLTPFLCLREVRESAPRVGLCTSIFCVSRDILSHNVCIKLLPINLCVKHPNKRYSSQTHYNSYSLSQKCLLQHKNVYTITWLSIMQCSCPTHNFLNKQLLSKPRLIFQD